MRVFNSLTKQKDEFVPMAPGKVNIYVCGITAYSHSHLGHARSYINFDTIVRWLKHSRLDVFHVRNITDVGHLAFDADEGDDKVQAAAKLAHKHPLAIAETFTQSFFEDMDKLNVLRPDVSPRASGHIPEMIALTERLVAVGAAYISNGSVYFDTSKASVLQLSHRQSEATESRISNSDKRNSADFALWKKADESHILQWNSPWGSGFPGWHIECSAMAMKYLGETFDIHGGGFDNHFPHHDCEILQAEAATGKPFARYWLHNQMVLVNGEKMSKSKNNFVTIKELIDPDWPTHPLFGKKHSPMALRVAILQAHYRSEMNITPEAMDAAEASVAKDCASSASAGWCA